MTFICFYGRQHKLLEDVYQLSHFWGHKALMG